MIRKRSQTEHRFLQLVKVFCNIFTARTRKCFSSVFFKFRIEMQDFNSSSKIKFAMIYLYEMLKLKYSSLILKHPIEMQDFNGSSKIKFAMIYRC